MLGEALSYPKSGEDWLKSVIIGGVLTLLGGFIFVTILPVLGYFVRVLRSAANDEHEAPVFDEWGDLFVDGIKVLLIQLAYAIVPFLILFVGIFVTGIGAISATEASGIGTGIGIFGVVILLVGFLAILVVSYLVPAALANFAYRDDLGAAFDFGTVIDAAFTADYFIALLLAFVVGVVLGSIGLLLSFIIVGIFVTFYVQVSVYYLFGRGFAKGLDLEPGGAEGAETTTAV